MTRIAINTTRDEMTETTCIFWPPLEGRHGLLATVFWLALVGCGGEVPPEAPASQEATKEPTATSTDPAPFVDATAESGLGFRHFNGMSGELYYSEIMGSGVALFDYDNDGDLDVYLVQGRMLGEGKALDGATFPPSPEMLPLHDRLFRNDLTADTGVPKFTDVTEGSGLHANGYGMGVATGDFDNDGWTDLYLTQAGSNQLWRNLGAGEDGTVKFADVTAAAGVDDPGFSLSVTWVDVDRDGWLDLYVVNYVDFTVEEHRPCQMLSGQPDYCGPQAFEPVRDRLFRNLGGDGGEVAFEDISATAGIDRPGAGMGVAASDFDRNGRPDLLVANDGMANFLWSQRDEGTFTDEALLSGTAFNREGQPEAGMGVDTGDFDRDGDDDLLITHLALETHTLYRNDGNGAFEDVTVASGLGASSFQATGFGAAWIDFDNDGWLDLLTVNGAVVRIPELAAAGELHPLGMPNQLFRSTGADGAAVRFEDVTAAAGEAFAGSAVSRGLAIGDLDNDGDADAVITHNAGAAQVLLNQIGQDRHWLGLRLLGGTAPRDMVGAEVEVARTKPGPRLWRRVTTGGSYLSARDPRVLFGLGEDPTIGEVTVRWPDGSTERFDAEPDRYTTLRQGNGRNE